MTKECKQEKWLANSRQFNLIIPCSLLQGKKNTSIKNKIKFDTLQLAAGRFIIFEKYSLKTILLTKTLAYYIINRCLL